MKILKDIKKNTYILIFITIVVMYFVLKDDFNNILDILLKIDLKYILIAIFLFILSIFFRAYVSYLTVGDKKKFSLCEAMKHNTIVQFFNGITPFSTGGQPMEIYLLTKHGVNANKGTMIILQNFIFYQVALVLFGVFAVCYNNIFHIFPKVLLLKKLVLIGFLINTIVAVGIFAISFSKKFTTWCMKITIRILAKLRIVRDKKELEEKLRVRLEEFHECAKILRKRKLLFVGGVFYNILGLCCLYAVPLFIIYSMHDFNSMNILECLTSSAYVLLIGSFVPVPGATGGIEYGFLTFFGNFLTSTKNSAVMLLWRFITYYLAMIIGAIALNFDKGER